MTLTYDNFPMPRDLGELQSDWPLEPDQGDGGTIVLPARAALELHDHAVVSAEHPKPTRPPFPRTLKRGSTGRDVIAMQRALGRAHIRDMAKHPCTGDYGWRTEWEVRSFQFHQGLKPTGVCDHPTWRRMNYPKPTGASLFDAFGFWLATHPMAKPTPPPETVRDRIVRFCMWYYLHAGETHYVQMRPMDQLVCPPAVNTQMDCSEFATNAYKCAGAPDPTGMGFDGYGNTDSMLSSGASVPLPQPGDLILYANPGHVTVCTKWPMCVSDGSEAAPYYLDARYRPIQAFRSYL